MSARVLVRIREKRCAACGQNLTIELLPASPLGTTHHEPMKQVAAAAAAAAAVQSSLAEKTPTPMPRAALRRLEPEAADIEYSTSDEDDESSSSTATSSSATRDGDDESTDTEPSYGEDGVRDEGVEAEVTEAADIADSIQQPMDDDVEQARKRKAQEEPPVVKVPRLDDEPSVSSEQSAEQSESESASSESSSEQSAASETSERSGPVAPQANNSSCAELLGEVTAVEAAPAVEKPLTLERVSASSYQYLPAVALDPWRGGGGAVQAVASSRARITTAKGERLDLIGMETADDVADDSEVSGGSEAFVTTEASGANPSAAIARATARAASIAGAALARGRARQGAEEYRIFISTSCTVRPSPVLEPSRLQITVSSDSELQQRQQPADSSLVIGEAEKKRVVSSPRRLDSRDSSENVFSLLRLGRQDTTQETITQELPSPAKGDKTDYADFEAVTRSVIQSRYNTERREDIADDYCRRASKAVQAEVQLMEQLKADESAQPTDLLGRIRSDQERFHDLKRQLDALKARQLARQRLLETPRELTTIPPRSPTVPSPKTPEEQRPPTISPQSGDSTMLGGNMAESAYISDSSDPSSPTSAEKANPHEPQRLPYRSVLQEAALLPGGARPTPRHHQSSLQLDQERLQRARNEYFRRPMFDPASKAGQSGSMRSGGSNSPSDYRARSASSTLSKTSSQSMYQLRELMDDQSALQAYSQLTGSGRRRYMSTDIDDLPDDGKAGGTPEGGSTYDLNAFDTEPGNYKSVSLFDLRRSMLANDARVANVTANDSKSYVSLIETDVDTGEELSHEIVMETDVDIDSPLSPAPKSQSLMDLAGMPRPNPGGIFDGLGARDAELDRRLNRANSEDMLDSGAAPTTARRVKASRNNSKRLQQQQQQQQEKTFIQRLEERATSESEKAICKSLSRLDIPKWMDNLKLNQNSASAVTVMASAVDAPKPWSAKYRDGPGSTAGIDHTDQSLQPLIIPKFVSLPVRPALFSPGYSSLSVRRDEATESDFERTQVATERSQPPPQTAPEEPRKKYFTESSIRRDSLSVAAVAASVRQQQAAPPAQARPPISPSLVLAPLKLDPSDFLPKTEKSAAVADEPRLEPAVAPRTAVVSESSALPPAPSPPRLSTLPPELLDGSSDESQNVGDDQPVSEASNIMFIDRSFRESSEQQLQQHFGDTSTTVSTDFPSDSQSDSGSASADRQQYEDDEETESSGSSEDSSDDSSTTGSSSSKSFSSGSPETSEAEDSGDEDEEVPQKPQPQSEPLTQTQYQLTNGSAKKGSSEFIGPESEQSSKLLSSSSQLQKKQHSRTASSSSSEGSSGSSGSGSSEDESAESEEETVIETSMMQSRLGRQPELDERLLASQAAGAAIVTFADGLGRQSQTAAALAYAEQQLATARSSRLSAPLAAAAAALPIPRFSQNGRNSPSVSLATEIPLAAGQNRGIIRDAGRYLVECVNPRCARRAELPEAQRSFMSCSSCYTYYCSVVCRRSHWEAHKRNCAFARAADACRNAAKRLLNDHTTYRALSTLARAGNRNLGRGCVLLLLADVGDSSAPLRPPVFAPVGDLGACGLVGEQLSEVAAACRSFDPSNAFVLCAGVSVGTESSAAGSGSGALVTAWSVLRLAPEDPATKEAVASVSAAAAAAEAAAEAAAAEAERRREEQMRQSRADLLDRVRRELRQRGVSLRHHYPRLMSALQEFVDTGAEFPPQVIRPVDTTCGKTFEYCVQPGADPVTRWVEPQQPPQPAPRRQQLQPPAPIRRSVVSTDL